MAQRSTGDGSGDWVSLGVEDEDLRPWARERLAIKIDDI